MKVISLTGRRSIRGPTSRYFAGSRSDHTVAGSITWSSTEMILGSSRMERTVALVSDGVSDSAGGASGVSSHPADGVRDAAFRGDPTNATSCRIRDAAVRGGRAG